MYKMSDGSVLTYEIKDSGYIINRDSKPWIVQPEPYAKMFVPKGTYEDNAKKQCEELCKPVEPTPTEDDKLTEVYSALDDLAQSVDSLSNKGE